MTTVTSKLSTFKPYFGNGKIFVGNRIGLPISRKGTMVIQNKKNQLKLNDVVVVNQMKNKIDFQLVN